MVTGMRPRRRPTPLCLTAPALALPQSLNPAGGAQELLLQIQYSAAESIVLVGHSHFFRAFFQR